ncbi:hypothetical protein RHSIM_Rhsim02G0255600 [Rhododendron simsii]|uniref:Uncharacterized protein n=1 Tax=Rhododendron simsii TaxID=118357 RepID=A0A834LZH7_RHOSS|nr:hypothetical protein RHSIM_Rhsim02G0255600 [Rhododendron simsii]
MEGVSLLLEWIAGGELLEKAHPDVEYQETKIFKTAMQASNVSSHSLHWIEVKVPMAMDESATATDMRTADAEYMEMAIRLQRRSVGGVEIDFLYNSGNSLFHSRLAKLFPKTST